MFKWLERLGGRAEEDDDLSCSFCGAHRTQVQALIAAPNAQICENCTLTAVDVLRGQTPEHGIIARALFAAYEQAPPEAAVERRAAWAAAEAWSKRDVPGRRLFSWWAGTRGRYADALEARRSIAPDERLAQDELAFAHLYGQLGDHAAAKAALDRVETDDETERALVCYHRVAVEIGSGRPSHARCSELLEELDAVEETLGLPVYLAAQRAELWLVQGHVSAARKAFDNAEPSLAPAGHPGYILGRVAEAEGDEEGAREAYARVVEHSPEHVLASAASEALARLGPGSMYKQPAS